MMPIGFPLLWALVLVSGQHLVDGFCPASRSTHWALNVVEEDMLFFITYGLGKIFVRVLS